MKDSSISSRSSRKLSGLCKQEGVPHLPPRKRPGYWLTPPEPSSNCASATSTLECSVALADSPPLEEPGAVSDYPFRRKRRCVLQLESDAEDEPVTRDLCTSFQNVQSSEPRKLDVVPWRSTIGTDSTSIGVDLPQSGTTSEDDLVRDGEDTQPGVDTVRSAAELLTLLTCRRSVDGSGKSPEVTSCTSHSRHARQGLELPIRWGVRKRVSYESRRSLDSCDLGLCTGVMRRFSYDHDRTSAPSPGRPPDQSTEADLSSARRGSHSSAKKSDGRSTSPYHPASSELACRVQGSSGGAGASSGLQLAGVTPQGPGDQKPDQTPGTPGRATCPGNILKLPREMQGRWSSERYRTAQLKLIDIMHARKAVPGKPILRPALREEARKHIGDTGLLDHLLKHMTDTVVSTGERFRRRHNSEGAMEYWLEHASLMELRKAAGVEDPSWIPPLGWKAGDKLPDRHWPLHRHGLTSSEAAEVKNLKDSVDRLKSDMQLLCGSIKVSSQRGVLSFPSIPHAMPLEDTPVRGEEQLDSTHEGIRKGSMIQFKTETTNMEQQFHQEHTPNSRTNVDLGISVEPGLGKAESEVIQIHTERTPQKEFPDLGSADQVDLEGQLQDVRKNVAIMQTDVSDIIYMLGIVPPIKATPVRYSRDPSTPGNPMPFMLPTRDGSSMSESPAGIPEPVLGHNFVTPKLDAPMGQCSAPSKTVVDQCSNGGDVVGNPVPYADGLAQALGNYGLVNQPVGLLSARAPVEENCKLTENTLSTGHESASPVLTNMKQRRAPCFKPIFAGQPTGFRLCRPAGSFVWPSTMKNYTAKQLQTNNPSMTAPRDVAAELLGPEDGSGNSSSRQAMGLSNLTQTMALVKPANFSTRSLAESQVAAAMASMFGCMAVAPHLSVPTQLAPIMDQVGWSAKGVLGTTTNHSARCSSPEAQSDSALSLALSLSVPIGCDDNTSDDLKK